MKTFLEIVAEDIIRRYGTQLNRIAIVFPNKRAALFLNEQLARLAGKPIWSPAYITISELFRQQTTLTVGDPIKLVCDLHKCFTEITGSTETIDHFYGWGQLMIADFDDIDKNMADADKVFANVKDIHEYDDISYLTEEQKELLKRFFANFTGDETELRQRFINLWQHFSNIYHSFKKRLREQGIAYEGMLYRDVAEKNDTAFDYDHYLFVGFNLVQKVERKVFKLLQQEGKAHFYWDFDRFYIDGNHEAGHYVNLYRQEFPNELDNHDDIIYNNFSKPKHISFVSASTENIQARYMAQWLKENHRIEDGRKTAIIMCDENLLPTVIHCLPKELEYVNITTGYPLQNTLASSFVSQFVQQYMFGGKLSFIRLERHPYSEYMDEETRQLLKQKKRKTPEMDQPQELMTLLLRTVKEIAQGIAQQNDDQAQLTNESLFRMYTLLNRLESLMKEGDLSADIHTIQRLIQQLIQGTSIPFHGEPAVGLQVMGVLESRNLDFDHVLLLSCNEGNMPKGVNDSSFIPYAVRKAYDLTTIDHKVAVFSYYFYSILQRASDITILYNNSTEDGHTGEMSRFMLQLLVDTTHPIQRGTLTAGQKLTPILPHPVEKDQEIMAILHDVLDHKTMTPTAINRYLRCPLQFYFNNIKGIKEPDNEDTEDIDNRIFGDIFHQASELIYKRIAASHQHLTEEDIKNKKLKDTLVTERDLQDINQAEIERVVDQAMRENLFNNAAKMPELNGLQIINREVIIRYLKRLINIDRQLAPFTIKGAEIWVNDQMKITTSEGTFNMKIGGIIDRLDQVTKDGVERIRVVDYKTGSKALNKKINEIAEIFERPMQRDKHPDYFLQTLLYAHMVRHHSQLNPQQLPVSPALLFIQHVAEENYDPTLSIGKEKLTDIKNSEQVFMEHLQSMLEEIFEPTVAFLPTEDRKLCAFCPYKMMCGL